MRIKFVAVVLALVATGCSAQRTSVATPEPIVTRWVVTPAAGLDALLLLGAASGDLMQADIYGEDIEWVRSSVSAEGLAAMDRIDAALRGRLGRLTGPVLVYFFSTGPVATIDDVIASSADPVSRLRPGHERSWRWDDEEFSSALRMMPTVHTALVALRDAGFEQRYDQAARASIERAVERNQAAVEDYDVIPQQEKLLGRKLDPTIEIFIANYSKPYGIKLVGQRFVAHYEYDAQTQLHIAAHEIFHSPFDGRDPTLLASLKALERDAWMQSIVRNHDPKFGYNSFLSIVDEDSTQALDQIVSEKLGFARPPGERWRDADGGMHMLAAALYDAMKEDGFAEQGGDYAMWLKSALARGLLSPDAVRRRASRVVGQTAVDLWHRASGPR